MNLTRKQRRAISAFKRRQARKQAGHTTPDGIRVKKGKVFKNGVWV